VVFAHDTEIALVSAAALVSTAGDDDALADLDALDAFLAQRGWTGAGARDAAELDAVRELRPRLRALWEADEDTVAAEVNRMLREAGALPQLVTHDGWGYHLHATPSDAPLADRIAVEAAMALSDVVRAQQLDRLRLCEVKDCGDVFVDLSKNRSRRYCSTACANRINVAAFRARRRELPGLSA
jgi:predicted RNA-binding Zn ribbon-like protein